MDLVKEAYMAGFTSAKESLKAKAPPHMSPIPPQNQVGGQNWVENKWRKGQGSKTPSFMKVRQTNKIKSVKNKASAYA